MAFPLRSVVFLALAASLFAAPDRVTRAIDNSRVRPLRGYRHPRATAQADQGPVDAAMPISNAMLMLKPGPGLDQFLIDQQTPSSPEYHHWLTPEQFADRFGATAGDTSKIAKWLESQGLRVRKIARGRQWISFDGTAATVGRAFHTEFHRYLVNGTAHFANSSEPSIPVALESAIAGIQGLHDFRLRPMHRRAALAPDFTSKSGRHYLAPDDVKTIYNFGPLYAAGIDGAGQTIAVIGQTDIDIEDIRAFRRGFHLPDNDPTIMLYGPDPGHSEGDEPEADLDIEWSGAAAPKANIIYVNSGDVITSLFFAIDDNLAPVISMSYGGCETENTPDLRTFGQQANAQGITWVVSSGDTGAAGCDFTTPTPQATKGAVPSFPASIPEVTAIGGTTFNEGSGTYWSSTNGPNSGSVLSYVPEVAWNDTPSRNELSATGGGASYFYPKPYWQSAPGVPNDGARDIPDVSLAASPDHDGYLVQTGGEQFVFGGTSVGTPIFAGTVALVNQYLVATGKIPQPGLGNVNPALYRLAQSSASVYHDTPSGDNIVPCAQLSPNCVDGKLGFTAGPGYDLATGLGSPDVWQLAKNWSVGVTSTTTLSASPSSADLKDTVILTATVTSSGTSRPTGAVQFLSSYNSLGVTNLTPGPGSSAIATLAVPMVRIAEGPGTVSALYNGDGVVESSGGSASVELKIPASGSLVVPSVDPNPVYQFGNSWQYSVSLQEVAGVATTITGFTFDGNSISLSLLPRTNLAAFGFLTAGLANAVPVVPTAGSHVFGFTGRDSNGRTWSQSVSAIFLPFNAPATEPSISVSSFPAVVAQNPNADPACPWAQQIRIQERGGFLTNLTQFSIGSSSYAGQIQQIFGTTRLAPYGMLYGNFCWDSKTVTPTKTFTVGGFAEFGNITASAGASYVAPPPAAAQFDISQKSLLFSGAATSASIDLKFTGGDTAWTVGTLSGDISSKWLSVSPTSGVGPGSVTVRVNTASLSTRLSNGVYRTYLTFLTQNAFPQAINVPVTLVVGGSAALSVNTVSNAASAGASGAPGARMNIFGLNLAPSAAVAEDVPLPLTLSGVSATVNGVTAPLYSVASGQIVLQVPYETAPGTAVLAINNNGQIAWREFPVAIAAPGIFADQTRFLTPVSTASQGQVATLFLTGDGDVTPTLATGESPAEGTPTNQLPRPRLPLTVTVGGISAPVTFRGITAGTVGVTQVNFRVPPAVGPGVQPVVVTVGGIASPSVSLTITAAPGN